MKRYLILMALTMALAGCSRDALVVDGEGIPRDVYETALKERLISLKQGNQRVNEQEVKKSVVEELVSEAVLLKEARAKKIAVSEEEVRRAMGMIRGGRSEQEFRDELKKEGIVYDSYMKLVKNRLVISMLIAGLVRDNAISDEQVKEFYEENKARFTAPGKVFMRIMEFSSEEEAKRVLRDVKSGGDFDALAEGLRKEKKAAVTAYGWLSPDVLSPDAAEAVKSAKLNIPYGPFRSKEGLFYIFRITQRTGPQPLAFDTVKGQLKGMLLQQRRQEAAAQIVEAGRKNAKIKVNI